PWSAFPAPRLPLSSGGPRRRPVAMIRVTHPRPPNLRLVDHRQRALQHELTGAVHLHHDALYLSQVLRLDLDHHPLERDSRLIDGDAVLANLELDGVLRL